MGDAYYGYTTGVNGMDMRGILEHSPNIPKRIIFVFSEPIEDNTIHLSQ